MQDCKRSHDVIHQ